MIPRLLNPFSGPPKLILLGPPCCGKGTLAQKLVERFALTHISTGEIFRSHLNEETPFGTEIRQCMQEGKLIPDHLVTSVTLGKIRTLQSGYILDGFPRTLPQAMELHSYVKDPTVYHLKVDDEIVIQRLSGRLQCGSCGSVFNVRFLPPKTEGVCDHCQEALVHREDDSREIVIERLRNYHKYSEPVIDFYASHGLLRSVETADLKPHEIYQKVIGGHL